MRQCFVCRERDQKDALERFTIRHGVFCRDKRGNLGGRGVYFHRQCLRCAEFLKIKRLEQALRVRPGTLNPIMIAEGLSFLEDD